MRCLQPAACLRVSLPGCQPGPSSAPCICHEWLAAQHFPHQRHACASPAANYTSWQVGPARACKGGRAAVRAGAGRNSVPLHPCPLHGSVSQGTLRIDRLEAQTSKHDELPLPLLHAPRSVPPTWARVSGAGRECRPAGPQGCSEQRHPVMSICSRSRGRCTALAFANACGAFANALCTLRVLLTAYPPCRRLRRHLHGAGLRLRLLLREHHLRERGAHRAPAAQALLASCLRPPGGMGTVRLPPPPAPPPPPAVRAGRDQP